VGRDRIEPPRPGFQSPIALDPKRRRSSIAEHSRLLSRLRIGERAGPWLDLPRLGRRRG
jgi:hypothetical protein